MECPNCKRNSREGETCEWCDQPLAAASGKGVAAPTQAATIQELESVSTTDAPTPPPAEPVAGVLGGEAVMPAPWSERLADYGIDRDTAPILLLILFHVVVSLARGGFTLFSLPIALWLLVGAGLAQRQAWSLALALLLVCVEIAFALFGIGPHPRSGLASWTQIDFLMTGLRIVSGFLILRLRDQLS